MSYNYYKESATSAREIYRPKRSNTNAFGFALGYNHKINYRYIYIYSNMKTTRHKRILLFRWSEPSLSVEWESRFHQ